MATMSVKYAIVVELRIWNGRVLFLLRYVYMRPLQTIIYSDWLTSGTCPRQGNDEIECNFTFSALQTAIAHVGE